MVSFQLFQLVYPEYFKRNAVKYFSFNKRPGVKFLDSNINLEKTFNGLYFKNKHNIKCIEKINYILILIVFLWFSADFYTGNLIILSVLPVITYANADLQKINILKNNKSGVYRWTNLLNNKSYVGSSVNLGRRFRVYFNINYLEMEIKKKQ